MANQYPVTKDDKLLEFLFETFKDQSKTAVREMLKQRRISVNGKIVTKFDLELKAGDTVGIVSKKDIRARAENSTEGLKILFEDNDIIVIYKPEGLLSIGTDADKEKTAYHILNNHVRKQGFNKHIFAVHRLDCKTSGVMLFAKSEEARDFFRSDWNNVVNERSYYAVTEGMPPKPKGTVKSWLTENARFKSFSTDFDNGGKEAITDYEVIQTNGKYSLLKLDLQTGRKNQIRVHMQDLGCPIAGDEKYGATTNPLKRLCLHAGTLEFIHPKTGESMSFSMPIPAGFKKISFDK